MGRVTVQELAADVVAAETAPPAGRAEARAPVCLLGGLCVVLAVTAVAVAGAGSGVPGLLGVEAGLVVAWAMSGTAIGLRRRQEPLGPLVLGGAALAGSGVLAAALARSADLEAGAIGVADAVARTVGALLPAVAFHLLLAVPDGRLVERGRRLLVQLGYAVGLATGGYLLVTGAASPVLPVWFEVALVALVGARPAYARYRRAGSVERRRLQWIGWAVSVATEIVLVGLALDLLADWPHRLLEIALASTGLVPIALVAGGSPRLAARVDRLLHHTVSIAGLTGLILVVYVVVVIGLGRVPVGGERSVLLLSMAAAAVAALLYLPARERLRVLANGLVYGEQAAPDESLRTFGSRLTRAFPLDELLLQLAESLRKTMRLASAEVWTGLGGRLERSVSLPHRDLTVMQLGTSEAQVVARAGVTGGTWLDIWLPQLVDGRDASLVRVAPIAHGGELLGLIVVERRPEAELFSDEDDRVLVELARQVGLALHNVQLDSALQDSLDELRRTNEELKASRTRIVAAGDAERRRLERNLHDGAQQHLVVLAMKVRLAHDAVGVDPDDARVLLDELKEDIKEAVAELRALAHGIFPPLLMAGGLPEALPAAARRAALPATVAAEGVGRYAEDVETAVYFSCLEALQNAGKHAGPGATAEVRVWEEAGTLRFEVADDGVGFALEGDQARGHGFVNMGDRLGAVDGTLSVDAAPGRGTHVAGTIPLTGRGGPRPTGGL